MIPAIYTESLVTPTISTAEKKAMKSEMELSVVNEPSEHFNTDDDAWLGGLLSDKRKGPLEVSVLLKDDMKEIC